VQISENHDHLLLLATRIVTAHVGHNETPIEALPGLIKDIYDTLAVIGAASSCTEASHCNHQHAKTHGHTHEASPAPHAAAAGAMPGVADDHLVCLEDGLTMKMLKRHLITVHGLTPDQYRAKWGLPPDYPMVAANYAKLRSALAKESGLGLRPEARPKRHR
jgi:predicted transcriptional regulator